MNAPTQKSRARRFRKLLFWAVGLLGFYALAGFLILPPIIRSVAVKQLSKQLHREVTIEKVKLNPFACSATIRGLSIKEKDGSPFVSWDEVYANVELTSLLRSTWVVKEVRVAKPFAHVQMNGDGSFNFSDILLALAGTNAPAPTPKKAAKPMAVRLDRLQISDAVLSLKREASTLTNAAAPVAAAAEVSTNKVDPILLLLQSVTNAFAQLQLSTNAGKATLTDIDITNCAVQLEDLANARPVRLNIDQIRLIAKNISNLGETNLTADLSLRWNTNGTIKTEVSANIMPAAADVHLMLNDLELRPLDPYLGSKLNIFILGSKLGMDGRVRLRGTNGGLPEVTFTGDTWLNDFHSVDSVLAEDLIKWDTIRISAINANLNPASIAIDEILVKDFYARLIIETNKTINVLAAMKLTETNVVAEEPAPPPPAPAKDAPKKSLLAGDSLIDTNMLAQLPVKKFSLGRLVVTNAHANYTDRSITPNVNMGVEQINGSVAGISSDELQRATIDIHASVDNVGPVDVTGVIAPFRGDETNEIKVLVKDVDLTPTSPYSGKFAGYRIAKGKLNVALEYHLRGRQLKSQNVITLDQFTFGEKVDSPDAVHLPVKLAIAVLKDRDGKIILDVPVEGSLDDPQLKLSKVIWHTLGNIIVKAATSPFAVLGAVFGGKGEEISYQDFPPGSTELIPASREKLDVLVKGLYERPGLQLEISGSVDPEADSDGLRAANLEKQLRMAKWLSLRKADRETTTADQVVVTPEERPALIKKLYADALAKGQLVTLTNKTSATNAIAAAKPSLFTPAKTDRGATDLIRKGTVPAVLTQAPPAAQSTNAAAVVTDPFETALLSSVTLNDSDYQALAAARAKVVREYILQSGKVETQRVFLTENQPGVVKTNGSRVYLQLQ